MNLRLAGGRRLGCPLSKVRAADGTADVGGEPGSDTIGVKHVSAPREEAHQLLIVVELAKAHRALQRDSLHPLRFREPHPRQFIQCLRTQPLPPKARKGHAAIPSHGAAEEGAGEVVFAAAPAEADGEEGEEEEGAGDDDDNDGQRRVEPPVVVVVAVAVAVAVSVSGGHLSHGAPEMEEEQEKKGYHFGGHGLMDREVKSLKHVMVINL